MNLQIDELSVEIIESDAENEDAFGGRWGWFWHECHRPPRGPFGSPAEALEDFSDWFARRYRASLEPLAPLPANQELARVFLTNAEGFLRTAEERGADPQFEEIAVSHACYALELMLNSYLLSRGRSDDWNRRNVHHDMLYARGQAVFLGMPGDDARIDRFLRAVTASFMCHGLMRLTEVRPGILKETDAVMAIRSLHRWLQQRYDDERCEGVAFTPVEEMRDTLARESRFSHP